MQPPAGKTPTLSAMTTLDRSSARRGETDYLAALLARPQARVLVVVGGKVVIRSNADRTAAQLALFHLADLPGPTPSLEAMQFLGVQPETGAAVFAFALSPEDAARRDPTGTMLAPAVDIRSLAMQGVLPAADLSLAATAVALVNWHDEMRYCGRCGGVMESNDGGWKRVCTACGHNVFPRTDPVVIMLVTDGDRCVLARQPHFPDGMVSTLAGFVEPGETIESAVARETEEEIGLTVEGVRYLASQPWPFPHSLMIGCIANAPHRPLSIDPAEIESASWWDRGDVRQMLAHKHPAGIWVPGPHAIAHWLIARFADGEL